MGCQWYQLDHMQIICTSSQTGSDAGILPLNCLQARYSSWCSGCAGAATGVWFVRPTEKHCESLLQYMQQNG